LFERVPLKIDHPTNLQEAAMSDRKSAKRISSLMKRLGKLPQDATKVMVTRLLRLALMMNRRSRFTATGFVLPTVVLLVLVVTLTTGALVFRAFNSSTNTIANNQNRVIYNTATPAVDRARSKLEYLFDASKDTRFPSGVPSEQFLMSMLLNDGATVKGRFAPQFRNNGEDPYNLPGEQRIDINGDGSVDNAWSYRADTDGNGSEDATVAYSIIFSTPPDSTAAIPSGTQPIKGPQRLVGLPDAEKVGLVNNASILDPSGRKIPYARSGPISNAAGLSCGTGGGGSRDGWYADRVSTSTLRKNFQLDALVIPDKGAGGATTLELQQDRQLDSGNKWGAWFRNDLELNPGAQFQWNGAMHTEGSFMVGQNRFEAHLISSPASCLFEPSASQISVTARKPNTKSTDPEALRGFRGLVMAGSIAQGNRDGSVPIYIHSNNPQFVTLNTSTDWASDKSPYEVALNPVVVQTRDQNKAVVGAGDNLDNRDAAKYDAPDTDFRGRFVQSSETPPYVDDTYRADSRYGPKPRYDNQISIPAANDAGQIIPLSATFGVGGTKTGADLIREAPNDGSGSDNVGLDGYWERRARNEGLRLLVGPRLELGNAFGWGGTSATLAPAPPDASISGDSLYPPVAPEATAISLRHEVQQNRTLRDNLSAVQATAIYHSAVGTDRDVPAACLATTAHPGTPTTLARSINFVPTVFGASTTTGATGNLLTDFFSGKGTNGWEFAAPTEADVTTGALRRALENLAKFAGDDQGTESLPTGAFPPTQEANIPHPYPMFSMWGNFSNLRRALRSGSYATLSTADKSYLYTAGCTLSMLAYNMNEVLSFDLANASNRTALVKIAKRIEELITKTPAGAIRDAYITAPVERLLDELEFPNHSLATLLGGPSTAVADVPTVAEVAIARTLATRAQIIRDRAYGFQRSPEDPNAPAAPVAPVEGVTLRVANLTGVTGPSGVDPYASDKTFLSDTSLLTPAQRSALLKLYGNPVPADSLTGASAGIQPKWPALYYLFPVVNNHNHDGTTGTPTTPQPANEPYIKDAYVKTTVNSATTYAAVNPDVVKLLPKSATGFTSSGGAWTLPYETNIENTDRYKHTNFVTAPNNTRVAVGFLDRVIYNGRERLPARVLDVDLGLLRRKPPSGVTSEPWLPKTGIVYAFREDAVREDGINRPAGTLAVSANGKTNATNVKPFGVTTPPFADQTDPPLEAQKLSAKTVDYLPDPGRRVHGFRLRDGSRLQRLFGVPTQENTKGLSFFTDNPVYVMDDFNVHEETGTTTPLEEFKDADRLWSYTSTDTPYTRDKFYNRRSLDQRFAAAATDEWRPSEILSDAVTILSDSFCDGSILDGFWKPGAGKPDANLPAALRNLYNSNTTGLYGPGCSGVGLTSFMNQNRPRLAEVTDQATTGSTAPERATDVGWGPLLPPATSSTPQRTWLRENPYDQNSPVRISRNGLPLTVDANAARFTSNKNQAGLPPRLHAVQPADSYTAAGYYNVANAGNADDNGAEARPLAPASAPGERVNAIIVSGISPSRQNQYNGGLHNFPRFLENWDKPTKRLWFSGSLLQLNFSNYAAANFDSDAWEPADTAVTNEAISYYAPPQRFWGYDVALQLSPSSPAAARFVTLSAIRNEFYSELPVNDAYMTALCKGIPISGAGSPPAGTIRPCS
jgi:hypothetical protein